MRTVVDCQSLRAVLWKVAHNWLSESDHVEREPPHPIARTPCLTVRGEASIHNIDIADCTVQHGGGVPYRTECLRYDRCNHRDADDESQGFVVGTSWVRHILAHLIRTHNHACGPGVVLISSTTVVRIVLYESDLQTVLRSTSIIHSSCTLVVYYIVVYYILRVFDTRYYKFSYDGGSKYQVHTRHRRQRRLSRLPPPKNPRGSHQSARHLTPSSSLLRIRTLTSPDCRKPNCCNFAPSIDRSIAGESRVGVQAAAGECPTGPARQDSAP